MTTFTGTAGDDTLDTGAYSGTSGSVVGFTGGTLLDLKDNVGDTIICQGGNDTVVAGTGIDSIFGGVGNDKLEGGGGADTLVGGKGDDSYAIQNAGVTIIENADEGIDTISTNLASFSLANLPNIENISIANRLDPDNQILAFDLVGNDSDNVFDSSLSTLSSAPVSSTVTMSGGIGDDQFLLGAGNDVCIGGVGNDTYRFQHKYAGGLDSVIENADGGTDTVIYSGDWVRSTYQLFDNCENLEILGKANGATIYGNELDNIITVDSYANTAGAPTSFDVILGLGGNDTIRGDGWVDKIDGGNGNDVIDAGANDDTLTGGAGDDTLTGGAGDDTLDGGDGIDTADYGEKSVSVFVALNDASDAAVAVGGVAEDLIRNIENLIGGSAGDTLTGDGLSNVIKGGAGNDTLSGGAGSDTIRGGDGNDTITDGSSDFAPDTVSGDGGDDHLIYAMPGVGGQWDGGADNDTIDFSSQSLLIGNALRMNFDLGLASTTVFTATFRNFENVVGSQRQDGLFGHDGANLLDGQGKADIIDGRGGDDTILGGSGADTITGGDGADTISGGDGADTITDGSADGKANIVNGDDGNDHLINTLAGVGGTWDGGAGRDTIDFSADTSASVFVITLVTGSFMVQNATFNGFENVLGHQASDIIQGSSVANRLRGLGGDDILYGYDGNDTLIGGSGSDFIQGGLGKDILNGGSGIDRLSYVGSGLGVTVNLATGVATGGDAAGDTIAGFENLVGSSQADVLTGNDRDNMINGMDGSDRLEGGGGNDTLDGGAGSDTFVLASAGSSRDMILSFVAADDSLEVSAAAFGGGLAGGAALLAGQLALNTTGKAGDADDRFILDTATGQFYFDSNGWDTGGRTLIATFIDLIPTLTVDDLRIV